MNTARWQRLAARVVGRADRSLHRHWPHVVRLDHPTSSANRPRYGYGRPPHQRIEALLAAHRDTYASELVALADFSDELLQLDLRAETPREPSWINPWLLGLDTVSLYGYVRRWKPDHYVEVGSGQSTLVVDRARRDGHLTTQITSIDPHPRAEIDAVCDRIERRALEDVDSSLFQRLAPGDVLFVDASHRVYMNSDMVAFYLDILPDLPDGVLVGIHDILWPDDYLPEWAEYWFSEQYLLGAYLIAETPWIRPLLAASYVAQQPDLQDILAPVFDDPRLIELDRRGFCFWFTKDRRPVDRR